MSAQTLGESDPTRPPTLRHRRPGVDEAAHGAGRVVVAHAEPGLQPRVSARPAGRWCADAAVAEPAQVGEQAPVVPAERAGGGVDRAAGGRGDPVAGVDELGPVGGRADPATVRGSCRGCRPSSRPRRAPSPPARRGCRACPAGRRARRSRRSGRGRRRPGRPISHVGGVAVVEADPHRRPGRRPRRGPGGRCRR